LLIFISFIKLLIKFAADEITLNQFERKVNQFMKIFSNYFQPQKHFRRFPSLPVVSRYFRHHGNDCKSG